jgi:hypothetical protein
MLYLSVTHQEESVFVFEMNPPPQKKKNFVFLNNTQLMVQKFLSKYFVVLSDIIIIYMCINLSSKDWRLLYSVEIFLKAGVIFAFQKRLS